MQQHPCLAICQHRPCLMYREVNIRDIQERAKGNGRGLTKKPFLIKSISFLTITLFSHEIDYSEHFSHHSSYILDTSSISIVTSLTN